MSHDGADHRFYGRRRGHALRPRHSLLVAELLPRLRFRGASLTEPAWLEIGFGGGEHLAHQAELHPGVSFLGAEPFVNGVAKLLALIEAKQLVNIQIHDGDARDLLPSLAAASLERIYLLYPDPWPKLRHNKRRFVTEAALAEFHRLLKPDGVFLFASDITDYVEWTRAAAAAQGGFAEEGDAGLAFEDWLETRYEAKARRAGRTSRYLRFRRLN